MHTSEINISGRQSQALLDRLIFLLYFLRQALMGMCASLFVFFMPEVRVPDSLFVLISCESLAY